MVVCVCNAIREQDLRTVARQGCETPCRAYAALGRRPACGQCISYARTIIAEERAAG